MNAERVSVRISQTRKASVRGIDGVSTCQVEVGYADVSAPSRANGVGPTAAVMAAGSQGASGESERACVPRSAGQ